MNKIEVQVLNPAALAETEKMMVCAARLTQRGQKIKNMNDFLDLYNTPFSQGTVRAMSKLPHPTIQKFGAINVVIIGASRRFLAQITRHQNEVKFMSASLQYSDYSDEADYVVPYELLDTLGQFEYLSSCAESMRHYKTLVDNYGDNDAAGYAAPQGLRNILIISATPYQWKHMINQRICRRNTSETRYVMLLIWKALHKVSPILFSGEAVGPFCSHGPCKEGKMSCGKPVYSNSTPDELLRQDFPKLIGGSSNED